MADTSDDEMREVFFRLAFGDKIISRKSVKAVEWGQNRVRKLELENENLTKTILALSNSPDPVDVGSGEEIHQRRRRERMLDQVTLICVRDGIERIQRTLDTEQDYGRDNRNTADNICHGINGFDATH
jgi:hypothetical protein